MLTALIWAAVAVVLLCPDTPAGRLLKTLLIDEPARRLAALTPGRVAFGVFVMVVICALVAFAKVGGGPAIAQAGGEGIAWLLAFDVGTYIDAIALVWLIAATVRVRAVWRMLRSPMVRTSLGVVSRIARKVASRDRSRRSRPAKPRTPKGDDPGWPAAAFSIA